MNKKLNPKFLEFTSYTELINYAEMVYNQTLPIEKLEEVSKNICNDRPGIVDKIICIKKDNDFCMIVKETNRTIVCFQKSNDIQDWISNFTFFQKINFKKFKEKNRFGLHSGFFKSTLKFKENIFKEIDPNKEIIVIGYSRGGALSIFMSMLLYKKFNKHVELFTIGCPRVLGSRFRDMFNKMNIHYNNVRNKRDVVCVLGTPLFKNLGIIKVLPIPFLWHFNFIKRHTKYYQNIKRLS
ncbi:MAG: lipase family protein [bacterium]